MRHSISRAAAAFLLVTLCVAPASGQHRSVSPLRIGAEVAAGTVAIPAGAIAGLFVGSGFRREANTTAAFLSGAAGAVLGPPLAVAGVGASGPSRGKFFPTVAGAAVGYLATGAVILVEKRDNSRFHSLIAAGSFFLPAIGATIAYNATRR
jgi:hypothetical protein